MRNRRGWVISDEDARSMLQLIEERITSSDIEVQHRDVLIRLRSLIEEDLTTATHGSPEARPERGLDPQT
jgi:hypothetical protein